VKVETIMQQIHLERCNNIQFYAHYFRCGISAFGQIRHQLIISCSNSCRGRV